jgi:hypothetical protein
MKAVDTTFCYALRGHHWIAERKQMPRKQSGKGKPVNAAGEELKAVRLELPLETHRRLRMQAAKEEMSMAALCKRLVDEYLKAQAKGGAK